MPFTYRNAALDNHSVELGRRGLLALVPAPVAQPAGRSNVALDIHAPTLSGDQVFGGAT